MSLHPSVCLIGLGNPLRTDDGLGPYVAQAIDAQGLARTDCLILHQLQTEIIADLIGYDLVIIVDAAVDGDALRLYPLKADAKPLSTSHHFNAAMLAALAKELYHRVPEIWLCCVKGEHFGMGETLSLATLHRAEQAIQAIIDFIQSRY